MEPQSHLEEAAQYLKLAIEKLYELGTVEALKEIGELATRLANIGQAIEHERLHREHHEKRAAGAPGSC